MKKLVLPLCVILSLILLTGCQKTSPQTTSENTTNEQTMETLNALTLEEKIGQMLIIESRFPNLTEEFKTTLETVKPGGFILFAENFSTLKQTEQLIEEIKSTSTLPMIFATDQEGGQVQRLKALKETIVSDIPSMSKVTETQNPELAYLLGRTMSSEMQVFGINVDFAPVLDVDDPSIENEIDERTFSTDKNMVSLMALSLASGLEDGGVIPVYKHFPGHGSTAIDSHNDLPIIEKSRQELEESDLVPFQNAINHHAKIIMVGHIAVPSLSNDNTPASLSKTIITDLLKNEMHYQGIVISDALNMKALTKYYTPEEIYTQAINAGIDMLLMPENPENAVEIIKKQVEEKKIDVQRIDDAVTKILNLKFQNLSQKQNDAKTLNSPINREIVSQISKEK